MIEITTSSNYTVDIVQIHTSLSPSKNTATAVVLLNTGFEMVGSAQFDQDIVEPTEEAYKKLRIEAVMDAIDNIINIDSQPKSVRDLFYGLYFV
ncbi:MAG: hypothetical protein JHC33_02555 [Ignisphaera sp.]|jgi:hypothetical protein|nr:hypothetical protein [Ignisphaera sp.]